MKKLKKSVFFKVAIIVVLILLLQIPSSMIQGLIHEREWVRNTAIDEVSAKWGNGQQLTGPFLAVPFDKLIKQSYVEDGTTKERMVEVKEWLYILPEELKINGEILPFKRNRGIYDVVVYDSKFSVAGAFAAFDLEAYELEAHQVHFDKSKLIFGISDLRGINDQVSLHWNDSICAFQSGPGNHQVVSNGIHVPLSIDPKQEAHSFALNLELKGSQFIQFLPMGKTSLVKLKSPWPTPSFNGSFLPDQREVSENGFEAEWKVLHLNRNFPQHWKGNAYGVKGNHFGLSLLLPVDNYTRSDRVAKYSILFIVLTFLVFFFVEVLNKVFIHPIQYLLVGMALVVFYTLLLSFSEHLLFNWAYVLSACLTLGLIWVYTRAVLKSRALAALVSGILVILYAFIFTIIQMEDFALLIGSLGLFTILSIVMIASRKLDWYSLQLGKREEAVE